MLLKIAEDIEVRTEELARIVAAETGNALRTQARPEAALAADIFRYFGGVAHELKGHTTQVHALAFTEDSQTLVTGSGDGTVRLFSVVTRESRTLRGHSATVFDVALAPGSALVASASGDKTIRLWPVTPPPTPAELSRWLAAATTFATVTDH